ncbi:MAG: metabolite traffic protein EboE [Gluconacetobacter diazotrophicus]|nr:metabolite traffic protein EboE [Gluconacetobacter diazotrophicus]
MRLAHGLHLAYCTNVHRGETWEETFAALRTHTLAVRDRVCPPGEDYGIGLRLSDRASRELAEPASLAEFRRWLDRERCYVFTINGFPYGTFHGAPVKESVYRPDWTDPARLAYTCRLFDLLGELLPPGVEGSVSTLPGSFKEFIAPAATEGAVQQIYAHLIQCAVHAAEVSGRTARPLRLALEPEPLGLFENTAETVRFLMPLVETFPGQFGVCFDACHFAVEFEEPARALAAFAEAEIPVVKLQLSAAVKTRDEAASRERLRAFADDVYLHQVAVRRGERPPFFYKDLDRALASGVTPGDEWRVHFHVPLHTPAEGVLGTTADALPGVFDWLAANPALCPHLEMETYTWGVLPSALRSSDVVDQLVREYEWTLAHLRKRGLTA